MYTVWDIAIDFFSLQLGYDEEDSYEPAVKEKVY